MDLSIGREVFVENSEKQILFCIFCVLLLESLRIDNFWMSKIRCRRDNCVDRISNQNESKHAKSPGADAPGLSVTGEEGNFGTGWYLDYAWPTLGSTGRV